MAHQGGEPEGKASPNHHSHHAAGHGGPPRLGREPPQRRQGDQGRCGGEGTDLALGAQQNRQDRHECTDGEARSRGQGRLDRPGPQGLGQPQLIAGMGAKGIVAGELFRPPGELFRP